jgi:oligopeptide transport system substrate-binding protein
VERCRHVLPDFDGQVGVRAVDDQTLVVTLDHPTPYFLHLVAFFPLYPVPRQCVERHGSPQWTRPENLVQSGPYQIAFRRIRDRIRLVRNPRYWNASAVQLEVIDALAVNSATTNLNMYLNGEVDWIASVPNAMIPQLRQRQDFLTAPMLTTYFYRVNVTRPPLDDRRVRAALNLAIDKRQICEAVTRGGQVPARGFVPPGIAGYHGAETGEFDVPQARRLLAEAGYPGGRGLRKLQLLYNTSEAHQDIAEVVQQQWKSHLGIDVELRNLEWGVYLDAVTKREYDIARAGWIGDYPDPNTFLDMFVTGGTNNQTGWGDARYDQLIREAQTTPDPHTRLAQLAEAETILMRELPILPIYFYVSINMVRPYVRGFAANILDVHPLHLLEVDAEEKDRILRGEGLR